VPDDRAVIERIIGKDMEAVIADFRAEPAEVKL
jgi:hypothetical protein